MNDPRFRAPYKVEQSTERVFSALMHLAISPVVLESGERLFAGVDLIALGDECAEHVGTAKAIHIVIRKE